MVEQPGCRLSKEEINRLKQMDELIQQEQTVTPVISEEERQQDMTFELANMLNRASTEQNYAYDFIVENTQTIGPLVVYGAAGCGKSFLLRMIQIAFELSGVKTVLLAPTGIAAHTIGGQTIHRFFGFDAQTGEPNMVRVQDFLKTNPRMVLLIDECSMLSATLVESMHNCLSILTKKNEWFGGVTVLFFGDIAQLPPVLKPQYLEGQQDEDDEGGVVAEGNFFFDHRFLEDAAQMRLKVNQRQRDSDLLFLSFLSKIRLNIFDEEVYEFIENRVYPPEQIPLEALRLFPKTADVITYNNDRLQMLPGVHRNYFSVDEGAEAGSKTFEETYLLQRLQLKEGAKCMLLQNLDVVAGWVNGTPCNVVRLADDIIFVEKAGDTGGACKAIKRITRSVYRTNCTRTQFPLCLAYAATGSLEFIKSYGAQSMPLRDARVSVLVETLQVHQQTPISSFIQQTLQVREGPLRSVRTRRVAAHVVDLNEEGDAPMTEPSVAETPPLPDDLVVIEPEQVNIAEETNASQEPTIESPSMSHAYYFRAVSPDFDVGLQSTGTHTQKYLDRHKQTEDLTMVEYLTVYKIIQEQDASETFEQEKRYLGTLSRDTRNNDEETVFDTRINKRIPIACTDKVGVR